MAHRAAMPTKRAAAGGRWQECATRRLVALLSLGVLQNYSTECAGGTEDL